MCPDAISLESFQTSVNHRVTQKLMLRVRVTTTDRTSYHCHLNKLQVQDIKTTGDLEVLLVLFSTLSPTLKAMGHEPFTQCSA